MKTGNFRGILDVTKFIKIKFDFVKTKKQNYIKKEIKQMDIIGGSIKLPKNFKINWDGIVTEETNLTEKLLKEIKNFELQTEEKAEILIISEKLYLDLLEELRKENKLIDDVFKVRTVFICSNDYESCAIIGKNSHMTGKL